MNVHELLKQVPGFRSGVWWKGVIAVLGYLLMALLMVTSVPGFVAGLEILTLVFLVTNAWGLRSRAPMLGSANKATAAGGWVLLTFLFLVAFALQLPTSEKAGRSVPGDSSVQAGDVAVEAKSGASQEPTPLPTATSTPKPAATPTVTQTPKPTSTPIPAIGSTLQTRNWKITVDSIERPGKTIVWSQFGNKSDAVGDFLVVYITFENIAKENFTLNSWDFQLKTQDAVTYKASSCCYLYDDVKGLLGLGKQMPPGVPGKASLIFDIAPGASGLSLAFIQEGGRTWALQ